MASLQLVAVGNRRKPWFLVNISLHQPNGLRIGRTQVGWLILHKNLYTHTYIVIYIYILVGGFKHEWIIFHFIYGMSSQPHWRSPWFFKIVETTNQYIYIYIIHTHIMFGWWRLWREGEATEGSQRPRVHDDNHGAVASAVVMRPPRDRSCHSSPVRQQMLVYVYIYIYIINQLLHIMGVIMVYKPITTYIYIYIHIWVNYDDLTVLPNPGIMVSKGNYPNMLLSQFSELL